MDGDDDDGDDEVFGCVQLPASPGGQQRTSERCPRGLFAIWEVQSENPNDQVQQL